MELTLDLRGAFFPPTKHPKSLAFFPPFIFVLFSPANATESLGPLGTPTITVERGSLDCDTLSICSSATAASHYYYACTLLPRMLVAPSLARGGEGGVGRGTFIWGRGGEGEGRVFRGSSSVALPLLRWVFIFWLDGYVWFWMSGYKFQCFFGVSSFLYSLWMWVNGWC